jgi:hypothetical protein
VCQINQLISRPDSLKRELFLLLITLCPMLYSYRVGDAADSVRRDALVNEIAGGMKAYGKGAACVVSSKSDSGRGPEVSGSWCTVPSARVRPTLHKFIR